MDLIADILLAAGALGAGFYCLVLSRRLKRFNDLEKGIGGAGALEQLTGRAETVAQRLELMMASMHDMPEAAVPEASLAAEERDALAEAYDSQDAPAKPADDASGGSGLMFVRHSRGQGG